MLMVAEAKSRAGIPLQSNYISQVLDYVLPNERRVITARYHDRMLCAHLETRSPNYTKREVDYLSSSEIAIATAQAAHILVDCFVREDGFPYPEQLSPSQLAAAREAHQVYFTRLTIRFRKKLVARDYKMNLHLDSVRLLVSGILMGRFTYEVPNFISGQFTATVDLGGIL
jgi:hypothetical protein